MAWLVTESCLVYNNCCELCYIFSNSVFGFTDDNIACFTVESEIIAGVIIYLFMFTVRYSLNLFVLLSILVLLRYSCQCLLLLFVSMDCLLFLFVASNLVSFTVSFVCSSPKHENAFWESITACAVHCHTPTEVKHFR